MELLKNHVFFGPQLKQKVRSLSSYQTSVLAAPHSLAQRLRTASTNTLKFTKSEKVNSWNVSCLFKNTLAAALASCVLLASPCHAEAEEMIVRLSGTAEVSTVQRTLIEAWNIVKNTYVDPTFNKQDWNLKLKETMENISSLDSAETAYSQVRSMLDTLGDPFTRIVTRREYENFRINNDGSVEGVGLLLAADGDSGRVIVLGTIDGGPAQRAGVLPGDELVQINDESLTGVSGEDAAVRLRGKAGTIVAVKLRRATDLVKDGKLEEIKLQRETIVFSPVFTALLPHTNTSGQTSNTGYIRLSTFSQNAAKDMKKAISTLEDKMVDSYILDLRNNPGGLVRAGLDVAEMWLDGNETLVNTVDRRGITYPINIASAHALTHDPLIVLVNEGSASASEILAGALHDNGRATIVGHRTYGKGKIQSVSQLEDGSALFVTVAKYFSPSMQQIDQVGISPDVECSPLDIASDSPSRETDKTQKSFLERDACVLVAEKLIN